MPGPMQSSWVRRRWGLLRLGALLGLAGLSLSACASPGAGSGVGGAGPTAQPSVSVSSAATTLRADNALYVAISAADSGKPATWLKTSPIRLWFEPLNGVRTAIIDAPVNTYNVPTIAGGGALWSGKDSSGSAVGCAFGCEADAFVGRLVSAPAHKATSGGVVTITAGTESVVFAPTGAPVPERSGCDLNSNDMFPCTRFISASGTDGTHVLDSLRTAPVTVTLVGSGKLRELTIHDGPETITAPVRIDGAVGITPAGSARTSPACRASNAACGRAGFFRSFFAARVTYKAHASSLLVTSGTRTLQLEAL